MPKRKYSFLILVLTVATLAFSVGAFARFLVLSARSVEMDERLMSASAEGPLGYVVAQEEPDGGRTSVAEANRNLFGQVYDRLKNHYVHEITNDRALALAAVQNMLATLDDPTALLIPAEAADDYIDQRSGRYHGIGAVLAVREFTDEAAGEKDRRLVIVSPVAGGPAEVTGIQAGDVVEKVNGKTVLSLKGFYKLIKTEQRLEELTHSVDPALLPLVLERLQERGDLDVRDKVSIEDARLTLISSKSRVVDLTIRRDGSQEPLDFEIRCLTFDPTGVDFAVDGTAGTLTLHSLGDGSFAQVRDALSQLADAGATSLVLDLRNNPGGSFDAAAKVAQLFIDEGPIAQLECGGNKRKPLDPSGDVERTGSFELVVLCNRGTAGAAEMLAGALSDRAGARLAGSRTFGDANWLDEVQLNDGSLVQFRSGRLLTPDGTDYLAVGLSPDTPIAGADSPEGVVRARVMQEALKLF